MVGLIFINRGCAIGKGWQKYNVYFCYMNHYSKCIHYIIATFYMYVLFIRAKY